MGTLGGEGLAEALQKQPQEGTEAAQALEQTQTLRKRCLALLSGALLTQGEPCTEPSAKRFHGEEDAFPPAWEAAWAEVEANCRAQNVEAAAWQRVGSAPPRHQGGTQNLRIYKAKVRFLVAQCRRTDEGMNLRRSILRGDVFADDLVCKQTEEFLSEGRLAERRHQRAEGLRSVWLKEAPLDFFDGRLTCPACGEVGARYAVLRDSWALPRCGGCMGHMRKDTGKHILAECGNCSERWEQEGIV